MNNEELEEIEIIDLDDEPYEVVERIEYNGKFYIAITPYNEAHDEDTVESEFTILRERETEEKDEDGESVYEIEDIEDEDLYNEVGEIFLKKFEEYEND